MTDVFTKKKRSEIMALIRSKNTKAELIAFDFLRKNKMHFQRHYKSIFGSIDVAKPRQKKAVFINGDFWHGRGGKKTIARLPKVYWQDKIINNVKRDRRVIRALIKGGWKVLTIWERDIRAAKTRQNSLNKIATFLRNK